MSQSSPYTPDKTGETAVGENKGNRPVVVGLGESLWDVFADASRFGGAPANFACHAAAFGTRAYIVSAVGDDASGQDALAIFRTHGVHTDAVATLPGTPTGSVRVELDPKGQPTYTFTGDVAWDQIPWTPALKILAGQADAVCFGTLAQRNHISRQTIRRFLDATNSCCLRVLDVNLRGSHYTREIVEESLRRATVLKLSDEELPVLAEMFGLDDGSDGERIAELRERFDLQWVVFTRGSRGATILGATEQAAAEAATVQVRDTVGAGDSFTATVTVGLLAGWPLTQLISHACRVAGYVCSQSGAVPPLPEDLRKDVN